jgi:transposase
MACDRQSEASLQTFDARSDGQPLPPPPRPRKRGRHPPAFAVREPWHRLSGVDLSQIEGLAEPTSVVILSELGRDRARWPPVKHCTSGLGLWPPQQGAGGTGLRRRTTSWANRAATALRRAAAALHPSQRALGACCRRMQARLGAPKASTATAHKLARLIYTMRKHGTAYVRRGMDAYEQQDRDRAVKQRTRRAKALGARRVQAPEGAPV